MCGNEFRTMEYVETLSAVKEPPAKRGPKGGPMVKADRFAEWLQMLVDKHGGPKEVSKVTGLSKRAIGEYISGQRKKVSVGTVDHATTQEGSTALWELCPELYE